MTAAEPVLGVVEVPSAFAYRFEDERDTVTYEDRRHRCYELAAKGQINLHLHGWDVRLTHGQVGPHANPHAWLEFRAGGQRCVWDPVLDKIIPWRDYRDRWHARRWSWYEVDDARVRVLNTLNFGPWGKDDERYERHHAAMDAAGVAVGIDWRERGSDAP